MEQFNIPWQIQTRMLAQDLTKEEVCEKVGINKRMFYLSITGRQKFSIDLVKKLAAVLNCGMEDLLAGIPETYK